MLHKLIIMSVNTILSSLTCALCMIYLRALKSWQKGQLSLAHGTETKKIIEKLQTKNNHY